MRTWRIPCSSLPDLERCPLLRGWTNRASEKLTEARGLHMQLEGVIPVSPDAPIPEGPEFFSMCDLL